MRVFREGPDEYARRVWREVFVEGAYRDYFAYTLKCHVIKYYRRKSGKPWTCTCSHGSLWGVKKLDEVCKHVKAVKEAMRRKNGLVW